MKSLKTIIIIIICFFSLSCNNDNAEEQVRRIDIMKAFKEKQNINLSSIVNEIDYITLETDKEILLGEAQRVFANEHYIIVIAFRQQYLFNRKTGAFIRKIGHYGRDPGAYLFTKFNLAFDEPKNVIYSGGLDGAIIEYSIEGEILNEVSKPSILNAFRSFTSIDDTTYIAYNPNFSGMDSVKLTIIGWDGKLQSTLPKYDRFIDNPSRIRSFGDNEGWFYRYNDKLYLKELFNDTIFELSGIPICANSKYIFDFGQKHPPYEKRDYMSDEDFFKYFWIQGLFESSKFLFFTLKYNEELRIGLYNKKDDITFIADSEDVDSYYYTWKKYGLINDVDNFIQMNPEYINSNNELIGLVQAYEIVNWFKENPRKAVKLPTNLQKLRNIKESDNPVVMIASLKD